MEQRVELQVHTVMSDDGSVITPRELLETAAEWQMPAVAVTCRNSVQDFPELARWAEKNQVKVIYGAEVCYKKENKCYYIVLLAKNKAGLKGLYQVLSSARPYYEYKEADWEQIAQNRENLLLGCPVWLPNELKETDKSLKRYDYIAVTPAPWQDGRQRQWELYTQAKELGIPVVAVGNCHYIDPEDEICRKIINRVDHAEWENATPLRTTEEMLQAVSYLGEDVAWEVTVANPALIASKVEEFSLIDGDLPRFQLPDGKETVARICRRQLLERYGANPPEQITARLEAELALLDLDASLVLVAHRLAKHLQEQGAITGCRGTVGSTLVAYLLDLCDVNPLPPHYHCPDCHYVAFADGCSGYDQPKKACPHCGKPMHRDGHNIPYETGLGLEPDWGIDIDINTPKGMQQTALNFLKQDLGEERVALAGDASTFRDKLAEAYVRVYAHQTGETISDAAMERIVKRLKLVKRQDGVLPAGAVRRPQWQQPFGVVLRPEGVQWEDITPMRAMNNPQDPITQATHLDYYSISDQLPKIDVLCYGIYDRLMRLFDATGTKPQDVNYSDPAVMQLFGLLDLLGIPEFDTDFCRDVLMTLYNIQFSDLVRVMGLAHSTGGWRDNAEYFMEENRDFQDVIGDRDDVFLLMVKHGMDRENAYKVMRTVRMGRFNPDNPRYPALREMVEKAGVSQWHIESMEKIRYLFPKAHGVHYVKLAVACAWFKVHYPQAFYDVTLEDLGVESLDGCCDEMLEALCRNPKTEERMKKAAALLLEARSCGHRNKF